MEATTTFGFPWLQILDRKSWPQILAANPGRKIPFRPEGKIEN